MLMHTLDCDHEGCTAELENYDGGVWMYDTPEEARKFAYDADWTTDGNGHDYCRDHRDDAERNEP